MLTLFVLTFLAAALGVAGLWLYFAPNRAHARLRELSPASGQPPQWNETALKLLGPLARLSLPEGQWERSHLRLRFLQAGIRHNDARLFYFGAKTLLPLLLAGLTLMLSPASASDGLTLAFHLCLSALVGCYLPNAVLYWIRYGRRQEIFETFPDAADLLLVCVEAGLGVDAAFTRVADEIRRESPALADELQLVNLEMRAGGGREKALRNLALRTGVEEIGTFATMLTQADKFGTSMGESLRVFSDDLRHKRRMRAEERAAKVPTKLLVPLVTCIFPAVIMVILGPAIIQIVRNVLPLFGG